MCFLYNFLCFFLTYHGQLHLTTENYAILRSHIVVVQYLVEKNLFNKPPNGGYLNYFELVPIENSGIMNIL